MPLVCQELPVWVYVLQLQPREHKLMTDKFYYTIINILKFGLKPITKISIEGLENIPATGGIVLAPNHISEIDPVLLGVEIAPVRPVRALAKASLFNLPIVGKVLHGMGHVPVLRDSPSAAGALEKAVEALQNGKAVAIYPEGTIPVNLTHIGKFKLGVAKASILSQKPVILVGQWGAQNILPPRTKNAWKYTLKAIFTKKQHHVKISKPHFPPQAEDLTDQNQIHQLAVAFTEELQEELENLVKPLRLLEPAHPKKYVSKKTI